MPDNSLSPGGRESGEFEEGGEKKSRKSERGQGKLQIEEGKVMEFKHRSSGNWTLHVQIPVDDRMDVLQSEIKIQIQHLPSLETAGQHLRDWGLL